MLETLRATNGMVVAPHHLASCVGIRVLAEGGNAIEAMIAAAATIAVVYPHMNGLGGDNFWLIHTPGNSPHGIASCGPAAAMATTDYYREQGLDSIPTRGPAAALTVAGAVAGWDRAHAYSQSECGGKLPPDRLLEDAIEYAARGSPITRSQHDNTVQKLDQLRDVDGFADTYLHNDAVPTIGTRFKQPRLAATLEQIATAGLADFYRGDLARSIANDLEHVGSPLRLADLEAYRARDVQPLSVRVAGNKVFNLPPPTQGLAALMLLAIYARVRAKNPDGFDFIHRIVESTKQAFLIRDSHLTDPAYMRGSAGDFLTHDGLDALAANIDLKRAAPWPAAPSGGDTVWLAAADNDGRVVSFIQSIFFEFGSGVVLKENGVCWQNRGTSFSLDESHLNALVPGRYPFHTIQPALAHLGDDRVMAYGTMGGDGQPQTQAAVFARHVLYGQDLQHAVTAPRWLFGRTWGEDTTSLKLESRIDEATRSALVQAGHDVEVVEPFSPMMGHAGALTVDSDGILTGACDPRSDGSVAGF